MKSYITRRKFLKISSLTSGLLGVQIILPIPLIGTPKKVDVLQPDLYIQLFADNSIIFNLSKHEMGQGVATGLSMIFADELGADLSKFKVEQSDYNPNFNQNVQGITGGSLSIAQCWLPLREAAASLRELLINEAAKIWQTDISNCFAKNSFVVHRLDKKQLSFGELIPYIQEKDLPAKPRLKNYEEFNYIGKSLPSVHISEIVSGQKQYGLDVKIEGMVYATIFRSPVNKGKILKIDDTEARKVKGVLDVVKVEQQIRNLREGMGIDYEYVVQEGVAIIASNTWAAIAGRKKLKVEWEFGKYAQWNTEKTRNTLLKDEEMDKKFINVNYTSKNEINPNLTQTLSAEYEIAFQAHCLMEPLNAIADVKADSCEIWTATQFGKRLAEEAASFLRMSSEKIKIHVLQAGGGFGRRWEADYAMEAVSISKLIGKPVKVIWTREDEIRHDFYHGYEIFRCNAMINTDKKPYSLDFERRAFENEYLLVHPWWNPYAYSLSGYKSQSFKYIPPVQIGPWRSVTSHKVAFVRESFIDELAHKAKMDPLTYRLDLLQTPIIIPQEVDNKEKWLESAERARVRTIRILKHVAEKSAWGKRKNQGIAVCRYQGDCANVVEVEINNKEIRIVRITASVYCGTIINPSLVKNQIEGGIIWALQAALYGGIELKNGQVVQSNFHDYKMVRMNDVSEIEIHLIESDDTPLGVGELGVPAFTPAFYNAIFAATGKRFRKIPLEPFE